MRGNADKRGVLSNWKDELDLQVSDQMAAQRKPLRLGIGQYLLGMQAALHQIPSSGESELNFLFQRAKVHHYLQLACLHRRLPTQARCEGAKRLDE